MTIKLIWADILKVPNFELCINNLPKLKPLY